MHGGRRDRHATWRAFPQPSPERRDPWPTASILVIAVLPGLSALSAVGFLAALCSWAVGLVAAQSAVRAADRSTTNLMAGLSVAGAVLGWREANAGPTLVLQGAALLVGWAEARGAGPARAIAHAIAGAAMTLGRWISALGLFVLAVPLVAIPWGIQRLTRWDPTWSPHGRDSRLVARHWSDGDARRNWSPDKRAVAAGPGHTVHRFGVLICAAIVVIGIVFSARAIVARLQERSDVGTAAMASSPWWPDARVAQFEVFEKARWSAYLGPVASDTDEPYVHVEDGRRQTWQPPAPPETDRVRVWMFGGSAAFGVGQRDEHTIASELTRLAWSDGLALEVVNYGFHGDVNWMEHTRLVHELASGEPRPDLAVFYDGFSELPTVGAVNQRGEALGSPFLGTLDTLDIDVQPPSLLRWLDRAVKGDPTVGPTTEVMAQPDVERAAADQYRASVKQLRRWLEGRGLVGRFFYQPSAASLSSAVPLDVQVSEEDRAATARFRAVLPPEVIDLAGIFDDVEQPVYLDGVHTNELGARVVAQAMYETMRNDLAAASP